MLLRINSRNGTDQSLRIFMLWMIENILCSTIFNNLARIHDGNPLTHAGNHTKVMGNHNDCHTKTVLQLHHQL